MSGREHLERIKAEHVPRDLLSSIPGAKRTICQKCSARSVEPRPWPCEQTLLVAAVEEALSYWAEDHPIAVAILSKLEDR
jgi:hypothetical protein